MPFIINLLSILFFLTIWQFLAGLFGNFSEYSPIAASQALVFLIIEGNLLADIFASLKRIVVGFLFASLAASFLAVISTRLKLLEKAVAAPIDLLSSIPPIAWTPLAILWLGIGDGPGYFIVFLGCFFPLFVGVQSAIGSVAKEHIDVARSLGANRQMVFREVIFPSATPRLLTALKTALLVGWFNVIAAELVGVSSGLGYRIQLSRILLFSDQVIAIMFVIGAVGWLMRKGLDIIEAISVPWSRDDLKENTTALALNRTMRRIIQKIWKPKINRKSDPKYLRIKDQPILEAVDVKASYPGRGQKKHRHKVLSEISFKINQNEIFAVLGGNGCGKTTLLRLIAGLHQLDAGKLNFYGFDIIAPNPSRTIVFQNFASFPWKTVYENVEFSLRASGQNHESRIVQEWLDKIGLYPAKDLFPFQLSGGMQQKLAVVRALAVKPHLILLDEPLSNFDPVARRKAYGDLIDLFKVNQTTAILVTHDIEEVIALADRVLVLGRTAHPPLGMFEANLSASARLEPWKHNEANLLREKIWGLLKTMG